MTPPKFAPGVGYSLAGRTFKNRTTDVGTSAEHCLLFKILPKLNRELCCRVISEFEVEECSIVENPASKLNRVISFNYEGKDIDVLTLREIEQKDDN